MSGHGLAVVGTGTEVGKTVVCALLLARYADDVRLAYWKPVASGAVEGRDTDTVAELTGGRVEILPEAYLLTEPFSPHQAAALDRVTIDPEHLANEFAHLSHRSGALVVEGVGGLLVPLTDEGYLLADLLAVFALPCLVVAWSGLGTINHTLLTLEALEARRIPVAGVVMNGPSNPQNRRAIERFGGADVVAEVEVFPELDAASLAAAALGFDPGGHLAGYLGARRADEP
jgi:dethiobiotin synthetase